MICGRFCVLAHPLYSNFGSGVDDNSNDGESCGEDNNGND